MEIFNRQPRVLSFSDLLLVDSQKPKSQRRKVKKVDTEKFWNEKKKFTDDSQTIYIIYGGSLTLNHTLHLYMGDTEKERKKERKKKNPGK
jgi:hypothetical protein